MSHNLLAQMRVVLKDTTHPGNIGATARAMKTMGLRRLYLVSPRTLIDSQSRALAAGALDVLADAVVCETLSEALAECAAVFAFTARRRDLSPTFITARDGGGVAAKNLAAGGEVAFVFGGERSGLTNEDVQRAGYAVEIPTAAAYFSLNLSQAVQIAVYELRQAIAMAPRAAPRNMPTQEQIERLVEHGREVLAVMQMPKRGSDDLLLSRLRRLVMRAEPDASEVRMLRGLLKAAQGRMRENE